MPKYQIVHNTQYRFDEPALGLTLLTCLKPIQNINQTLGFHKITCVPSARVRLEKVDIFGNVQQQLQFHRALQKVEVSAMSEVTINGLQQPIKSAPHEPSWNELFDIAELNNILVESCKFAGDIFALKKRLPEKIEMLMSRVFKGFVYDVSATKIDTSLLELYKLRRGVCQDFTRLCIAVLQAHNIAARYVSGYLYCNPCEENLVRQSASHAWVSVFIPNEGWRDFDPTNNQWADENYISVGWGRDYVDVIPLKGILDEANRQRINVSVTIEKKV
ncbi:transglutaminase family protein [Paraglaciecola sp.]|uniref:transglutaminase family protein n=1 Tax=Paraglaciecola sp. TaxID=1920173 RepID=UPI003EF803A7